MYQERKRQAHENEDSVPKHALYDLQNKYFFRANPRMLLDNKDDKNDNIIAMTVVAIAFPDNLTKHMFNDHNLGMYDLRKIANAVNSSVAAKIKELEIKHCNREEDGNFNLKSLKNQ